MARPPRPARPPLRSNPGSPLDEALGRGRGARSDWQGNLLAEGPWLADAELAADSLVLTLGEGDERLAIGVLEKVFQFGLVGVAGAVAGFFNVLHKGVQQVVQQLHWQVMGVDGTLQGHEYTGPAWVPGVCGGSCDDRGRRQ